MVRCRYILSEAASGAMNMALDEALLESTARESQSFPTLRIYAWARPTLSLGYFQAIQEREAHAASRDCDLVRRPSGGGAILHDCELTYALILPGAIAKGEAASGWYFKVHRALIDAVAGLTGARPTLCEVAKKRAARDEPFLCFQRRAEGDVLLGEQKVAGSAQRRRRDAILQHGSVLLERSSHAPELPGICELTNTSQCTFEALADRLTSQIGARLHWEMEPATLSERELGIAGPLASEKYGAAAWTRRR